jgi:hypothetical protein
MHVLLIANCQRKKGGQKHRESRAEKVARKLVGSVLHNEEDSIFLLQGAQRCATVQGSYNMRDTSNATTLTH